MFSYTFHTFLNKQTWIEKNLIENDSKYVHYSQLL